MASMRARLVAASMLVVAMGAVMGACSSPEARRVRDGGPGADPGNKRLVERPHVDPKAADTTLWPGRAPAPLERLEAGTMSPPPPPVQLGPSPAAKSPSPAEQGAFEKSARDR
jgi:hypothetical protein